MVDRSPQLELSNQLCFALYSASRAAVRAYGPALAELDLTYPQYLTMLVLWEARLPLAVGDIGVKLRLDSGTLTPLIKRLEAAGLVRRVRDVDDERRVLVGLTDSGRGLRKKAEGVPARVFARYGIDAAKARSLLTDLSQLANSLESV